MTKSKCISTTEFTVTRGGFRIAGTRCASKNANGIPVIISHGFLGNRKSVAGYAEALAAWGYTAYTFDFVGGGPKNDSDGSMTDMSVLTEKEDLLAVMDYVRQDASVNFDSLVLMGCSQGGFVSAMVAAEHPAEIKKLILIYPALCIPDDARSGKMMFFKFDPKQMPDTVSAFLGSLKISRQYIADAMKLDAFQAIEPYDGEVLIVHGTADRIVNFHYAERAKETFGERAQLLPVQGADHGFKKKEDALAIEAVRQFLSGRREVLTVDVRISKPSLVQHGLTSTLTIPFDGFAKGPYFEGVIQPGAQDVQKRRGMKCVEFCASYALRGVDQAGQGCTVEIQNRTTDGVHWTPTVKTDSTELSFLNGAPCEAVLESRKTGPIVHLYAETEGNTGNTI